MMAYAVPAARAVEHHDESDYGSELDDGDIEKLLTPVESQALAAPLVLESIEEDPPTPRKQPLRVKHVPGLLQRPPRILIDEDGVAFEVLAHDGPLREPSIEVEYDESNRVAFSRKLCTYTTSLYLSDLLTLASCSAKIHHSSNSACDISRARRRCDRR